jgi:DUF4097 and DUF4098 domain-containing protein YvlB
MMMVTALLTSVMMAWTASCSGLNTGTQRDDFRERDEINETYQLAPGARVEVSSIRGPVEIVNSDTAMAEVQIIRTARTRADLEYHKIEVQHTGNSLVVRGVQEPEARRRDNIRVNHHVILKLPRHIDLSVNSISGWIKVGDVDGEIHVNSISGSTTIGNVGGKLQVSSVSGSLEVGNVGEEARVNSISGSLRLGKVNGYLNVSSISGSLNAALVGLSPQGIHINSVSGSVEIAFNSEVNADFTSESVTGEVFLEVPNVLRESEEKSSNVRARIGAGGTPIRITSISGNIRLRRS